MSSDQKIRFSELSRADSQKYLDLFEYNEYKDSFSGTNWWGSDEANYYLWLVDITDPFNEIPIGFIGFNLYTLPKEEFIYIVKFYVLNDYRKYDNETERKLIDGKKVSSLLFDKIKSKRKDIITLTPANNALEKYYQKEYGFTYNYKVCDKLASNISVNCDRILYLDLAKEIRNLKNEDTLTSLFGQI